MTEVDHRLVQHSNSGGFSFLSHTHIQANNTFLLVKKIMSQYTSIQKDSQVIINSHDYLSISFQCILLSARPFSSPLSSEQWPQPDGGCLLIFISACVAPVRAKRRKCPGHFLLEMRGVIPHNPRRVGWLLTL